MDAIVLSTAPLGPDARVRRHVGVLRSAGLKVATITGAEAPAMGLASTNATELAGIEIPPTAWTLPRKAMAAAVFVAARAVPGERAAVAMARAMPGVGAVAKRLQILLEGLPTSQKPRLVLANDWVTLPAAIQAHDRFGCRIHYDSHELAVAEHDSNRLWRLVFPPLIARIERAGLRRATSASCVSPGIAHEMTRLYGLTKSPLVHRNVPDQVPLQPKPTGDRIDVLYHGLFKPDRGLLRLVESVQFWPANYHLVLRGSAPNAAFGSALVSAAQAQGMRGRVTLEPMVPVDAVVRAANRADIGVFLPDLTSRQNRHALPNKLFEYLGAGLMTIVPAQTDMAEIVTGYGAGIALAAADPQELAGVLTQLTPASLSAFKMAAHRAAQSLTFAAEAKTLLAALDVA